MRQRVGGTTAFTAALGWVTSGVNMAAMRRDGQDALLAAARLQEYRDYLAQARAAKAAGGSASGIDRQVLAHGREALADVHTLSTAAVKVARNLYHGGALDALAASWVRAAHAAGSIRTADVWQHAIAPQEAQLAIQRAGVSDSLLSALNEGMRAHDILISADGSRLLAESTFDGRLVRGALETAPRPPRPTGVLDLLTRGRFEALTDAVARGEPAYLDGVGTGHPDPRVEDLVLYGVLGVVGEGTRHVRKLEDTGLATHGGGSPGAIGVIAGLSILAVIIGGIIVAAECKGDTSSEDSSTCTAGRLLQFLGSAVLLVLFLAGKGPNKPPVGTSNSLVMGSVLVHGIGQDLEGGRS